MTTNGQRRPREILAQIDRTRGDMDSTLSAIEQRLSPGQLLDQGLDYLRHSGGSQFASNLGNSVRDNPLPVALVGIGVAWLMAAGKADGANGGSRLSSGALGQQAGEALDATKQSLSSMKQQAGATLQSAREQTQRVTNGIDYIVREQPLALGAIGLAIGAVLAAAAPRTGAEDELLGEASDRLTERAKEMGKERLQKVQQDLSQDGERTPTPAAPSGSETTPRPG